MILSCSTITWGELKDINEFDRALASIRAMGYSDVGIEFPLLSPSLQRDLARSGGAPKRAGLTVSAVAIDASPEMAKIVREFGSSVGWLCLFETDIESAIEKTKKLSGASAKAGVDVALHPHVRSSIETTEDLDRIMKACAPNRTSVCVDPAHLTGLDIDVPKFIERYKGSISLVHFKDLRSKKPQQEIDYATDFVDLGEGVADLKGTLMALRAIGYSGAVMVEVDYPQKGVVEVSARKNYDFLVSIAGPAGRRTPARRPSPAGIQTRRR
ncbi:MAG: sugar phosphate isomerase/epimerase [Thaumarchaeota archaeon]|nr:sugar phosphate isomerase/epimerase [Nitrososphaerota archaeon]